VRAAVLYGPRDLRVEERPVPEPPRGWLLLRSVAVGVCGTDKAFYAGSYRPPRLPLVPGHEAVGLVVSAPPGWEELVGRLVVPEINLVDACEMWREPCRSGLYIHCPSPTKRTLGIDSDGAMAEYFAAPPHLVHDVEGVAPESAVLVEPLAAVLKAFTVEPLRPGDRVAVVGTGLLAFLAAQVARIHGVEPLVVARRGSSKARVFERRGFTVVYGRGEALDAARRHGRWGMGFDVVFEATGSPEGLNIAVEVARPGAVVHVKSTHGEAAPLDQTMAVVKELRLTASRCGTGREFEEAVRLLREGLVAAPPLEVLWGLERAPEAFEKALEPGVFRVVLRVSRLPWETRWPPPGWRGQRS